MVRRPPAAPTAEPELMLKELADAARAKITERMELGEAMRAKHPQSIADVEHLKEQHTSWQRFNALMLKRMFTTDEIEREYLHSPDAGNVVMRSDFYGGGGSDLDDLQHDLNAELGCLRGILDRLAIIPVAMATAGMASAGVSAPRPTGTRRVFVVHGHDGTARESVARMLERLGLQPVILHEQAGGGDTLVEKLERHSDVAYAVVLLTPDDEGRAKGAIAAPLAPRARQNVILELGYFAAKLGRRGVCALYTHGVELPSDWNGVEWVEMDGAGGWRFKLGRELKHAGFDVDLNDLA
jgi:predicted nucleotide-binding protein